MTDLPAIRQCLARIDQLGRADLGNANAHTIARLQNTGLPCELVELFTLCWPQTPGRAFAGPFRLASSEQLITPYLEEEINRFGLLFFAIAGNGDTLAVDLRSANYPVLIFDSSNWDGKLESIRSLAFEIADTLLAFFVRAIADDLPVDYWDARSMKDSNG